jgi:hypothetical protein
VKPRRVAVNRSMSCFSMVNGTKALFKLCAFAAKAVSVPAILC